MTILSWNVAGAASNRLAYLLDHAVAASPWLAICLQEGLRKLEGADAGAHAIFTPSELDGGLRCPAVIVHAKLAAQAKQAAAGRRWVAVDVGKDMVIISAHLPHARRSLQEYTLVLQELDHFLQTRSGRRVVLGMDANVRMASLRDPGLIGPAVPHAMRDITAMERSRAAALHELMSKRRLMAANTFATESTRELLVTRHAWKAESGGEQVDFILSSGWWLVESHVDQHLQVDSDHRAVSAEFLYTGPSLKGTRGARCVRNWKPTPEWKTEAEELTDWSSGWALAAASLREKAAQCQERKGGATDPILQELLHQQRALTASFGPERRKLDRAIWRRRRHWKREKQHQLLEQAAAGGRAPPGPRPTLHVNWGRLCVGGASPRNMLTKHFEQLYKLDGPERQKAATRREEVLAAWRAADQTTDSTFTLELFYGALAKLKPGKGSPDGITAEMLKALPKRARDALGLDLLRRCRTLEFEEDWATSVAGLIPKVPNARELTKFRGLFSLCTMRKLLGYMFLLATPRLNLLSVQTAFVPGAHACGGAHLLLRVGELSREWGVQACMAQLDLKKAFDHVSHVAAFEAMEIQKVPLAAQALIAKLWDMTTVVGKLGRETSSPINLDRGVPQGAPESPIIFTMVVEMVLRKVRDTWKERGAGWMLDGLWVWAVCYADDLVLIAHSPAELSRMCNDLIHEFRLIGLGVGADKTHWTSSPPRPCDTLEVDGHSVVWERNLTYVGTVIDMSGTSGPAMQLRMATATRKLEQWRPILMAPWLALRRRAELTATVLWSSVLWCAQTWTTTKTQRANLDAWASRAFSRVIGLSKHPLEEVGHWWRRMHRVGRTALLSHGPALSTLCQRAAFRWAGHVARMEPSQWLASAVRCRSLQWWRFHQARHTCKWTGLHPKRFKAWRWESQCSAMFGDGSAETPAENTGWLATAQDRAKWKEALAAV